MPDTQDNITTSGSSSVATVKSALIDIHHPFFLHSSDAPGMTLVNNPFDGRGYQG
ncbi:hypothetical protein KY284_019181 [Solanum tuberosum]|nr:hypothetical protein KY284_019181 [Solanum tuberosum]